jgi:Domain of unknown function (DUF4136)
VSAKHLALAGIAAMMTASCAPGVRIETDRAQPTLSEYHTYFLLPGHSSGDPDHLDQRVRSDLTAAFAGRGWVDAPRNEADAVVVIHAATAKEHADSAFYEGWGGWGWGQFTESRASGPLHEYKPGSIVIDIFDARTKQAIWRGVATDAAIDVRPKDVRLTQAAINKLFLRFPTIEATGDGQERAIAIDGELPRITFAQLPAVLIAVDGHPVYREIPGTDLWRVVNTRAFIVRDDSGIHYLRLANRWMQAYTLTGWWSPAGTVPDGTDAAFEQAVAAKAVDATDRSGASASRSDDSVEAGLPTVYVTSTPMELIVTDGPPAFVPFEATTLQYLENTSAHVFREPTDQELYVFLTGQWYRAWTTDGPWQRLSTDELPADLAKLPADVLEQEPSRHAATAARS